MSTPIEQIEAFIKAHPGEWHHADPYGDGKFGEQRLLVRPGIYLCLVISLGRADSVVVAHGHEVDFYGASLPGYDLLRRGAARVADALQLYGGTLDTMPPWLQDHVEAQLRQRAATLLALADGAPPCS